MEYAIVTELRASLAAPFDADAARVRMPDRAYPAGLYVPGNTVPAPSVFSPVRGVAPVSAVTRFGNVLCFSFTDAFYDMLVRTALETLPAPTTDAGSLAVNRMLRLTRLVSTSSELCPAIPSVQRAVWLAFLSTNGKGAHLDAERAAAQMLLELPPAERRTASVRSARAADAVGRVLLASPRFDNPSRT